MPSTPEDDDDNKPLGLTGKGFVRRTKHSDSGSNDDDDKGSFELEKLVAKEVDEWRSEVDRSQTALRHRKNVSSSTRNALEDVSDYHCLSLDICSDHYLSVKHSYPIYSYVAHPRTLRSIGAVHPIYGDFVCQ